MSVIEFFVAYWDWWLFIGFVIALSALADNHVSMTWGALVAIFLCPPIYFFFYLKR